MAKFISQAGKVYRGMNNEGRVKTLTSEKSALLDHELAQSLSRIKGEFLVKEKNSRAFVANMELAKLAR